jgi:hypothetical protein
MRDFIIFLLVLVAGTGLLFMLHEAFVACRRQPATVLTWDAAYRWSALSELESGNADGMIGRAGELTRYQILPSLWWTYCPPDNQDDYEDSSVALRVAHAIMAGRVRRFERANHRLPSDWEFYVLWNAPGQLEFNRVVSVVVAERAGRFVNLCNRERLNTP